MRKKSKFGEHFIFILMLRIALVYKIQPFVNDSAEDIKKYGQEKEVNQCIKRVFTLFMFFTMINN